MYTLATKIMGYKKTKTTTSFNSKENDSTAKKANCI